MAFLILIFLTIISVYLTVFLTDFILYVICAHKLKGYLIQQKYFNHPYCNQLSVIIYAHNDEKAVVSLLEKLNKQEYSKNNYQVDIVLDNCTDNSSNILEFVGGAKIWRVGDNETIGKDASISWVLERLISFQNVNAYVFLDVNCTIDEKFLTNINSALFTGDVLIGSTELVAEDADLITNVKIAYNKFCNRIIQTGRRFMFNGLSSAINSDITVIKQEVLEKIKCIDFQSSDAELKYTTLLVKNGIIPKYTPNVVVYSDAKNYQFKRATFKRKITLFSHCLSLLLTKNLKFIEHILYLIKPNMALTFLLALILLYFTYTYELPALFNFVVSIVFPLSILALLYSVFVLSGLKKKEYLYIMLYPIYSLLNPLKNFKSLKSVTSKLFSEKNSVQVLEKFAVDVVVCGGQKSFKCKLEIIKEDNFSRAIFIFKKKKYKSASYLRVYEAISEIIDKLNEHGFRLTICQTCGYFCPNFDTEANDIKGICHCNRSFEQQDNTDESADKEEFFWGLCEKYIPKEINNVIDMSTYRQV